MTTKHDVEAALEGVQHRQMAFQLREASNPEAREVEGISVPFGQIADLGFFTEEVARGAVDDDDAVIFYAHREAVGRLSHAEDTDAGRFVRAKISKTTLGEDVMTLARDGVLANFSIGFEPIEYTTREDGDKVHITHTKIKVREISLVPLPAYSGAKVTNVRQAGVITKEGTHHMGNTQIETPLVSAPEPDLETRAAIDDLERQVSILAGRVGDGQGSAPALDTRSMGEVLRAIAVGRDQETIDLYNSIMTRAYTGGTISDAITRNTWVGDLTRIVDEAAPLLDLFERGDLPDTGMTIEYGQLKTNTVTVAKQENEGDDLTYGKVAVETKTADVETFGGYGELSFQAVQRASVNLLNVLLTAQGIAAGKAMNSKMRSVFQSVFSDQVTAGNTVGVPATGADYSDWIDAIVDAAIKYEALGLPITGLVTNATVFKALGRLTASDGRPVLLVRGDGVNNVGEFNPVGLAGNLAGVTVRLDAGLPAESAPETPLATAAFVNRNAIRAYIDPVSRLQDENIINLTKQYSVYRYAAFAPEIPSAVVPVAFA